MRKIERLRIDALEACENRGHCMSTFTTYHGQKSARLAYCLDCGMRVDIDSSPPANGIDIGGEAVALNCPGAAYTVKEDRYGGVTLRQNETGFDVYFQGDEGQDFLHSIGSDERFLVLVAPDYFGGE